MVDAVRVERGSPPLDAVNGITLIKQQFRQIGAILPRDTGYQGHFRGVGSFAHKIIPSDWKQECAPNRSCLPRPENWMATESTKGHGKYRKTDEREESSQQNPENDTQLQTLSDHSDFKFDLQNQQTARVFTLNFSVYSVDSVAINNVFFHAKFTITPRTPITSNETSTETVKTFQRCFILPRINSAP